MNNNSLDDEQSNCDFVDSMSPVVQSNLKGVKVCGRRGGKPYLNVTRADSKIGGCQDGYEPCYQFNDSAINEKQNENLESMICVPEGKKDDPDEGCPITGVTFDLNKVDEKWRSTYTQSQI